MKICINEESREVPDGATVADIVETLSINPKFVAVEVNLELIPRDEHATHMLADGDQLEVVTLVGGG
ncbi:sulfur carrier protein ThiS [Bremerella cremea]|uniref:Thiamine biosynthesis protein ThiS n=1 Tax=Blastopirellula marina TaxID=124 RepID=A0A2S8FL73_9BACT|nr:MULTISPECIES: sulfur carrier protein ThiS [Pirellulaceae]PQO32897.1 thiamine biosynthesis protein ThiS [Blastopirellula marina]RCS45966.1 sulfur carrier protein ThiS [Bremerella cremea]